MIEDPRKRILDSNQIEEPEREAPRNALVRTTFQVPKVTTHLLDGFRAER